MTSPSNDLRIDGRGTLREFADWQQVQDSCALDSTQIMELKHASLLFKRHENRTYESLQRKLDKPSNHPIHFAFPKHQVDAAGIQSLKPARRIFWCNAVRTLKYHSIYFHILSTFMLPMLLFTKVMELTFWVLRTYVRGKTRSSRRRTSNRTRTLSSPRPKQPLQRRSSRS